MMSTQGSVRKGGNSPLAITLDEYKKYFQRRASVWERLALVRARHLAGSKRLGNDVIKAIHNFVYSRPFVHSEISEIITMRKIIEKSSARRYVGLTNVKSGYGGIVDIDFIAQSYSAHFGVKNTRVRFQDTPHILCALGRENILNRHDISSLTDSYSFLCTVEKSIRIGSGKSVNTLPKSGVELARVARLMGFKNVRRFSKQLQDTLTVTRDLYDRLMQELLEFSDIS